MGGGPPPPGPLPRAVPSTAKRERGGELLKSRSRLPSPAQFAGEGLGEGAPPRSESPPPALSCRGLPHAPVRRVNHG
jgi:hypothetical protein